MEPQLHAALVSLGLQNEHAVSAEAFLAALAAQGLRVQDNRAALQQLVHPGKTCSKCNGPLSPHWNENVPAHILDVDGWKQTMHVPVRCRRREGNCCLSGKRVWYNFIALDKNNHTWHWPPNNATGQIGAAFAI